LRALVTGATGHVGANLCRLLVERGDTVVALCHTESDALDGVELERAEGDVLKVETLRAAVDGVDVAFHLAARISIDGDRDGQVHAVNVEGTRNVVAACLSAGVDRLVHCSSFHAFTQAPFDEELTEERPRVGSSAFPYDRSKVAGEREVMAGIERGLPAVILNPTAILGPHDYKPSLMGEVLLDLYHGRLPSLVPGGSDWVDVRDVCDAAVSALEHGTPGERYLLGGGWTTVGELAAVAESITGRKRPRLTTPLWLARAGVPFAKLHSRLTGRRPLYTQESLDRLVRSSRCVSHAKATRDLGFNPRALRTTLEDAYAWFATVGRLG
jgi:dihydroflavonol-4-reductase